MSSTVEPDEARQGATSSRGLTGYRNRLLFMLLDILVWVVTIPVAALLRFEFDVDSAVQPGLGGIILVTVVLQLVLGYGAGIYRGRYGYGTFDEVRSVSILAAMIAVLTTVFLLIVGTEWEVPRSLMLIASPIALILFLGVRYIYRLLRERRMGPGAEATPTIVYGAGVLGENMIRRMQMDDDSRSRPVALLDDDPALRNLVVRGVPVKGTLQDLEDVAKSTGATELIVAISSADHRLVREVADAATDTGVHISVLPLLSRELASHARLSDLRQLSIEDIIGREPVDTSVGTAAGYLAGKKVLVTGAGGSIGAELCRQILRFSPAELIMLDRDETALQSAQIGTVGHGLLHTRDVVLADIRDYDTLKEVFEDRRPDVVYHAAALKHLPMLEQYPDEAWKSNVLGTLNVLRAAQAVDVETFINISTDKAANPTSVLGHSKRMAEKLTAYTAQQTGKPYLSVRFGNVIGSRGSMLPTFRTLIENGGPVTVTHPDVTRYFMTIPEACHLVIQAGAIGRPGEVMILDMGEPVRILEIAERMIAMSGKDVSIKFTGLRKGEKLHEELIGEGEMDERPFHPKISHASVGPFNPSDLKREGWLRYIGYKVEEGDVVGSTPLNAAGEERDNLDQGAPSDESASVKKGQ